MQYTEGMRLRFIPIDESLQESEVTVVGLRKGGCAKLSNGWLVDAYGVCEGNASHKGARVCLLGEAPAVIPKKRGKYKHRPTQIRATNE